MMRPVKSRNGNNLRAKEESRPDRRARFCSSFTVNPGSEMKFEINLVFCALVVLTGSSQARAQSSASPPVLPLAAFPDHAGSSASPDPTEDSGKKVPQQIPDPAGGGRASAKPTTATETEGANSSEAAANAVTPTHTLAAEAAPSPPVNVPVVVTALPDTASPTAAADSLSSAPAVRSTVAPRQVSPTAGGASLTRNPLSTLSSQPDQDTTSAAHASTLPRSESPTTASTQAAATTATAGGTLTLAPGRGPAGPTHQEVPSELNVGDEGLKGPHYGSPLDPLLASLLSVFIVTTAIVFVILFLKFRQRTNHPEFHRLQDLPMDDLMEDTPLSRYSY